jgi:Flagellar hook-length control protein FliK
VVENTAALLHLAADRGVTHARLNLKPVELGGIEVRLQSTPEGVSAQLVADSPEAARMLTQAGDDLRKQLADQNVNLLSLDVSTSGDQQQNPARFGADAGGDTGYRGSSRLRPVGLADVAAPAPAESTLLLPTGVLVDVLA